MDQKTAALYLARACMHALRIFPVKEKKILFCSFTGKSINCNPMYFNRFLLEYASAEYEYVWVVNDPERIFVPEDLKGKIRLVKAGSPAYFRELATAGIVIYNVGLPSGSLVPKRKTQIWVDTWHGGGAFKAADMNAEKTPVRQAIDRMIGRQIDIFLSSNRVFTEQVSRAMQVKLSHFQPTGLPRNDLFFRDFSMCRDKVRKALGIPEEQKLFLYAPTFRGNFLHAKEAEAIDYEAVKEALEERFGGNFAVLERKHHAVQATETKGTYSASDYPDMQELLAAADVLITDYSSCMWDFALTDKPGFLYFPDVRQFDRNKDFYTQPEEWPYEYAESTEALRQLILSYDPEKAEKRRNAFFEKVGNYEKGTACAQLAELLKIKKKENR